MLFPKIRSWIKEHIAPSDILDALIGQVTYLPSKATPYGIASYILLDAANAGIANEKYLVDLYKIETDPVIIQQQQMIDNMIINPGAMIKQYDGIHKFEQR